MTRRAGRSFISLEVPNYRRYFAGQVVSLAGNWMQIGRRDVAGPEAHRQRRAVGLAAALQFLPILLFGALGGVLADRLPKRRAADDHAGADGVPALTLFALTVGRRVEMWMVFALVFARGAVNAIDNPARQSFVIELVGPDRVVNAVALNSVIVHTARIAGPAAAGAVIALLGVGAVLPRQRALLRRDDRRAARHGPRRAAPRRPAAARARRSCAPRCAYVRPTPGAADPAGDDGRGRHAVASTSRSCCRCSRASPGTARRRPTRC